MAKRGRPKHPDVLTPREWEVLALIREGLSNEEIAANLGISVDGAKYHVSQILMKLGVPDRVAAARWQPDEESRKSWAPVAPLLALGRLPPTYISYAVLASLGIVILAGAGVLALALVATNDAASETPSIGSEFPPLPGPDPNAEVVAVSPEIASPNDPVFYVYDEDDPERVIAYGWDGQRRGELVVESDEPYGFIPSLDGTMALLAYADAHIVSGGEAVGRADPGTWTGDNAHLCVFLNELGGQGGPRERQISENTLEGQATAAALYVQTTDGERRRVANYGAFNYHGGPRFSRVTQKRIGW